MKVARSVGQDDGKGDSVKQEGAGVRHTVQQRNVRATSGLFQNRQLAHDSLCRVAINHPKLHHLHGHWDPQRPRVDLPHLTVCAFPENSHLLKVFELGHKVLPLGDQLGGALHTRATSRRATECVPQSKPLTDTRCETSAERRNPKMHGCFTADTAPRRVKSAETGHAHLGDRVPFKVELVGVDRHFRRRGRSGSGPAHSSGASLPDPCNEAQRTAR